MDYEIFLEFLKSFETDDNEVVMIIFANGSGVIEDSYQVALLEFDYIDELKEQILSWWKRKIDKMEREKNGT